MNLSLEELKRRNDNSQQEKTPPEPPPQQPSYYPAADRELGGDATANQLPATAVPQPQGTERGDGADAFTGWEAEREILFHPKIALAKSANQPGMAVTVPDIGGIVGSVVQFGKSVERLDCFVLIRDVTAKPAVKEHKKGIGQKEDDHSGYDFEMTM